MSYEFRFNVIENVTAALTGIGNGFLRAEDLAGDFVARVGKVEPELRETRGAVEALERELNRAFDGDAPEELGRGIRQNEREMRELRGETVRTERAMDALGLSGFGVSRMVGSIGVALAGLGLGVVVRDGVIMQSQFEATEVALGNAFGNLELAKGALKEVTELAASTPFGIQELQEGYSRLVNSGFRPVKEDLIALGDIAAAQKKPFEQLVEAVMDAARGQGERLIDMGMSMSVMGDKVAIRYGDKIQKIVPKTEAAIRGAIVEFGKLEGVSGVMEAVSQSTAGILSNLEDKWSLTKLSIGEAFRPLLVDFAPQAEQAMAGLTGYVQVFAAWIVQNKSEIMALAGAAVPALAAVASWVGLLVVSWALYRGYVLAAATAQGIANAATWIQTNAVKAATFAQGAYLFITNGLARSIMIATAQQWLFNTALFANPIGWIVIGIIAAIAAIVALAYYFDGFREFLFAWGEFLLKASPFYWLWQVVDYLFPSVTEGIADAMGSVMDWFKTAWDYIYSTFIEPFVGFVSAFTDLSFDITATPKIEEPEGEPSPDQQSALEKAREQMEGAKTPTANGTTAGGSVASSIGGLTAGGGSGGPKTINITIHRLVENLNVYAASAKESVADVEREMMRALTGAINEANYTID